jgi:helix-turn-helix protein
MADNTLAASANTLSTRSEVTRLLTREEVADICDVTCWTVIRWVRCGYLTPVRLTRKTVRFRAEDVARFIDSKAGITPIDPYFRGRPPIPENKP